MPTLQRSQLILVVAQALDDGLAKHTRMLMTSGEKAVITAEIVDAIDVAQNPPPAKPYRPVPDTELVEARHLTGEHRVLRCTAFDTFEFHRPVKIATQGDRIYVAWSNNAVSTHQIHEALAAAVDPVAADHWQAGDKVMRNLTRGSAA